MYCRNLSQTTVAALQQSLPVVELEHDFRASSTFDYCTFSKHRMYSRYKRSFFFCT